MSVVPKKHSETQESNSMLNDLPPSLKLEILQIKTIAMNGRSSRDGKSTYYPISMDVKHVISST